MVVQVQRTSDCLYGLFPINSATSLFVIVSLASKSSATSIT